MILPSANLRPSLLTLGMEPQVFRGPTGDTVFCLTSFSPLITRCPSKLPGTILPVGLCHISWHAKGPPVTFAELMQDGMKEMGRARNQTGDPQSALGKL